MLKSFLATDKPVLLAMEDDVIFKDLDGLQAALNELPDNWDILYLGANITSMVFGIEQNPQVRYSAHLHRVKRAWTTHAVAYTRRMADIIVRHYPVTTFEMYDNWISGNLLEHYNAYLVNPMVAWQRPGKSDLWGTDTDYTGAFAEGNKIMSK
jgi:GR25 family glycosyltransferase involved in LPS biosynthesis